MSKYMGHYFFWYLKAEMEHPGYKQRFGILLEAYLRGCGDNMLVRYCGPVLRRGQYIKWAFLCLKGTCTHMYVPLVGRPG